MALENGFKILSEKQILKIIDESCHINEKIGILVENKKIRKILGSSSLLVREVIKKDLIELTRISGSLDEINFIGLQAVPQGSNAFLSRIEAFEIIMKNTVRPLVLNPLSTSLIPG